VTHKYCCKCQQYLHLSRYHLDTRSVDGRRGTCRTCSGDRRRQQLKELKSREDPKIYAYINRRLQDVSLDWVKVGYTGKSINTRLGWMTTASPFGKEDFPLVAVVSHPDAKKLELVIHRKLALLGERKYEWFRVDVPDVIEVIEQVTGVSNEHTGV